MICFTHFNNIVERISILFLPYSIFGMSYFSFYVFLSGRMFINDRLNVLKRIRMICQGHLCVIQEYRPS